MDERMKPGDRARRGVQRRRGRDRDHAARPEVKVPHVAHVLPESPAGQAGQPGCGTSDHAALQGRPRGLPGGIPPGLCECDGQPDHDHAPCSVLCPTRSERPLVAWHPVKGSSSGDEVRQMIRGLSKQYGLPVMLRLAVVLLIVGALVAYATPISSTRALV